MASSLEEFRESLRKVVTLPDGGQQVEIRRVWQMDFAGTGELPEPPDDEKTPEESKKADEATINNILDRCRRIIIAGATSPRFTDDESVAAQGAALYVRELPQENFWFLASAILQYSGLTKEVRADADTFCPDGVGDNGEGPGQGVREVSK